MSNHSTLEYKVTLHATNAGSGSARSLDKNPSSEFTLNPPEGEGWTYKEALWAAHQVLYVVWERVSPSPSKKD